MVTNQKASGRAAGIPVGILLGLCTSVLLTVLGSGLLAWLILSGKIAHDGVGYGSLMILLLSSLVGPMIASGVIKHRRLFVCMITGAGYYGVLLSMTALFFGGQYTGMAITGLVVLIGSVAASLTGLVGKGGKTKVKKYRNR